MKPNRHYLAALSLLWLGASCGGDAAAEHDALTLWYDRPATRWEETLPLGNGRLGAMPDGGVVRERIVLNEITMWSGSEEDPGNPDALQALPRIRQLLAEGRNLEAQELMYDRFVCRGGGSGSPCYGCYQTLGALTLDFGGDTASVRGYERGLRLSDATAYTRYERGGVRYERDYFVSRSGDVTVVRLRASRPGSLHVTLGLERPERSTVSVGDGCLTMSGTLASGRPDREGVAYRCRAAVRTRGGSVGEGSGVLVVRDADEAVICLSAATSYWDGDYLHRVDSLLEAALGSDFDAMRRAHTADYRRLFDRVSLDLGPADTETPTDRRLLRYGEHPDPSFAALYMQYGRYLLISSTREGSLPPNLQGLWADGPGTPWNGDYHLNINVEMNHWIAETGNLAELHRPLVDYTRRLVPSGERTARTFYGTGGWCAHVLANAWNFTAPSEDPAWGATNTGGAWLALHLWEHYRFTPDTTYLREVYPVLRGAAQFFLENLVPELGTGFLVTSPTTSPENGFYDESRERVTYVCMGATMDIQIVRELFGAVCEAAAILGRDADFAGRLHEASLRLPPHRVDSQGRLQEWLREYEEMDPHHRHVSHLFGLFPGSQITPSRTPGLLDACRATLERRGDDGTGWSRAWKICFWARLGDGNRAHKLLGSLLQPALMPGTEGWRGGTFPNLFCSHPPFQIDGNFGGAAGIVEMLLQSHDGRIALLPALPGAWPSGSFRGLKARGGVEVGCRWSGGEVRGVTLRAATARRVRLMLPDGTLHEVDCPAGREVRLAF